MTTAVLDKESMVKLVHELIKKQNWPKNRNASMIGHLNLAFPSGFIGHPLYPQSLYSVPDDGSHVDELIKKAADEPLAFDAACTRASHELRQGQIVSQTLKIFAADVLAGTTKRPSNRTGNPGARLHEQQWICTLVTFLVDRGYAATRNEASSHRNSACDILAKALGREGLKPKTYGHVKRIWVQGKDKDFVRLPRA